MSAEHTAWTIWEGRPEDSHALRELFQECFGYDRGEHHDQWKFADNPAGAPAFMVAEDAGRIVGSNLQWPTPIRIGAEVILGAQSIDTMTHPDYRGQGMFARLGKATFGCAADRGVELLVAFPNSQSYHGAVRTVGWEPIGDAPMYLRPLRPSLHPRVPSWAGPGIDRAARLIPRGGKRGIETRVAQPAGAELASLWQAADRDRSGCRVDKDAAYFDWRFDARAGRQYRWVCAYRNGALSAAAVWGVDNHSGQATLAQLVGTDDNAMRAALAQVVNQALASGCAAMSAIGRDDHLNGILRRSGFFRHGSFPIVVKQLTARTFPVDIRNSASWTFFGADLDTM